MILAHIAGVPAEETLGPVMFGAGLMWVCVRLQFSRVRRAVARRDHDDP